MTTERERENAYVSRGGGACHSRSRSRHRLLLVNRLDEWNVLPMGMEHRRLSPARQHSSAAVVQSHIPSGNPHLSSFSFLFRFYLSFSPSFLFARYVTVCNLHQSSHDITCVVVHAVYDRQPAGPGTGMRVGRLL